MPSVRTIEASAFNGCEQLVNFELPDVERIERFAFDRCVNLHRIAIPLKDNMFPLNPMTQRYAQFDRCNNLTTVDLVCGGGVTKPSPLSS